MRTYKKLTGNNGVQFTPTSTEYQASAKCSELISSNDGNQLTTGSDNKLYMNTLHYLHVGGEDTYRDLITALSKNLNLCFIKEDDDGADERYYYIGSLNNGMIHVYRMDFNGVSSSLVHKVIDANSSLDDTINFA